MNPFSPEARASRRLARLQQIAGAFSSSPSMLGDQSDEPLDRRSLPSAAIRLASDFLGQFDFPIPPQLVYRGVRTATRDEGTPAIEADAQVILSAQIITLTGCRRDIELPIVVRAGKLLEPSVMVVDGVPRIIAQSLVDEITRQGTFRQKVDPRGGMYAPPLDQEAYDAYNDLDDAFKTQDRYSRGLYSIAEKRTAQGFPGEYGGGPSSHLVLEESRPGQFVTWNQEGHIAWPEVEGLDKLLALLQRTQSGLESVAIRYLDGRRETRQMGKEGRQAQGGEDLPIEKRSPLSVWGDKVPEVGETVGVPNGSGVVVGIDWMDSTISKAPNVRVKDERGTMELYPLESIQRQAGRQAAATVDQVIREIESSKEEGYSDLDVLLSVSQKYPAIADAVMEAARDKGLLDLDGD